MDATAAYTYMLQRYVASTVLISIQCVQVANITEGAGILRLMRQGRFGWTMVFCLFVLLFVVFYSKKH